ncbi:MAG: hypothetical protein ABWK53_12805 [Anaerolineales bacterium]
MEKQNVLTKPLALAGAVLVWLPLLAPLLLSAIFLIDTGRLRFDYLMPAELFLAALVGGGLLLWAAWQARLPKGWIGWGLGLAAIMLAGGQALAVVSGLASGETPIGGWQWGLVLTSLAIYMLGLIILGIGSLRLLKGLFSRRK